MKTTAERTTIAMGPEMRHQGQDAPKQAVRDKTGPGGAGTSPRPSNQASNGAEGPGYSMKEETLTCLVVFGILGTLSTLAGLAGWWAGENPFCWALVGFLALPALLLVLLWAR